MTATRTELVRGLGLPQSSALNISNMVGIGPFITIPGFIAAAVYLLMNVSIIAVIP